MPALWNLCIGISLCQFLLCCAMHSMLVVLIGRRRTLTLQGSTKEPTLESINHWEQNLKVFVCMRVVCPITSWRWILCRTWWTWAKWLWSLLSYTQCMQFIFSLLLQQYTIFVIFLFSAEFQAVIRKPGISSQSRLCKSCVCRIITPLWLSVLYLSVTPLPWTGSSHWAEEGNDVDMLMHG